MGNPEHYGLLLHGHDVWNKWRFKNPKTKSELNQATLNGVNLYGINLKGTDLTNANLMDAYVNEVIFDRSKFALLGYYGLLPQLESDLPEILRQVRQRGCRSAP